MPGQSALRRLKLSVALLAAAAQICITSAPLGETRSGADARAHVETAGTRLHHAHNEANCAACVSQHLLATTEPGRPGHFLFVSAQARPAAAVLYADCRALRSFTRSRAPPATPV